MIRPALLCLALAAPVAAQDASATQTAAAAARLNAADQLLRDAPHSEQMIATLVAATQTYEDGLIAVRAGLRDTNAQRDALRAALIADRDQVAQLLTVLQAPNTPTRPALAIHPDGARSTIRAQMMQASLSRNIEADAAHLREQLVLYQKVATLTETASTTLQLGEAGLASAQSTLRVALAEQPAPPERFTEDPAVIAALSDAATTRDQFIDALTRLYDGGLPSDATLASKGALLLPVSGRALPQDTQSPGLIVATPAGALLVAPSSATILYQGPLPGFSNAVVLEPTSGTTFVFGGLGETFGKAGQIIPAGWPLGFVVGANRPSDTELTTNTVAGAGNDAQALYLEVREGQTLVDPASWFALEQQMDVK